MNTSTNHLPHQFICNLCANLTSTRRAHAVSANERAARHANHDEHRAAAVSPVVRDALQRGQCARVAQSRHGTRAVRAIGFAHRERCDFSKRHAKRAPQANHRKMKPEQQEDDTRRALLVPVARRRIECVEELKVVCLERSI